MMTLGFPMSVPAPVGSAAICGPELRQREFDNWLPKFRAELIHAWECHRAWVDSEISFLKMEGIEVAED